MKGRRRTGLYVVAALLAVAAALSVLLLRDGGSAEPDATDAEERGDAETSGEAARAEGDGPRRPLSLPSAARLQRDRAERSGTLEGQVLDFATGEPVADAELTFARRGAASSAITTLEGEFFFRAAEPGTYELATVTAEGYLPYAPEWGHSPISFHARPSVRIQGITIHLRPELEYQGRVVDPGGRPVAGAEVVVLGTPSGQTALVPLSDSHVSDEAGELTFAAPDWALVEARREGFSPGRARVDTKAQITHRLEIRLRAGEGGASEEMISGVVVDGADQPVAEALVAARFTFARSRLHTTDQTVTDDAGRFTLEGLDRGRYDVVATRSGLAPARARGVPTGATDVRLVLNEGGSLVGTVTEEATGEPVPSFSVVVQRPMGPLSRAPYRTETVFDAEGRYEVTGVEPGHFTVLVSAHGFAPSDEVSVTLRGGVGESARADIALPRGGAVTGVVTTTGTGEPVAGARVSLEARAGGEDSPVPVVASTVTGEDGRFAMQGLAEGLRSIVVTAAHHHRRIVSGLQVREGGDVGPVTVEVTPLEEGEEPEIELTGIGAVLHVFREGLMIRQVVEGGGAAEVGLRPGDVILAVDGVSAIDLGFEGSIERIRGQENTTVRLTVRRIGAAEPEELVVPRRRIRA